MPPEPAAELLDVVDADDRVVGQAPRALVHRHGLRHRAAHVLLFDPAGRLYVQQRAWTKDCQPGRWDTSAAGHLDCGETYLAAAQRELAEELGIEACVLEPCAALPAMPATGHEFVHVFRGVSAQEPRPDPLEIQQGRWLTPAALRAWMAAEPACFTAVLRALLADVVA